MLTLKKNYASLKSSAGNLYELTDDDIKKMHEVLLEIYDDVYAYCEKHSLKLIAGGGTALGAVRHKGFIPWDDDMDLNLTRTDYEKFIQYFDNDLGDKYDLLAPGYKKGSICFLMRILKKNTVLLNMIDESSPYPTGIYIDITPIDYAPNGKIAQKIKGIGADVFRFISYSVYWRQYSSRSLEEFMTHSEGRTYYKLRMATGAVFSFRTSEQWFQTFDKFILGKESNYVTVAAGRKKYCGEIYHKDTFFPLKKIPFEGRQIYVYNKVGKYLKGLYGDYMKIPNPEDREKHLCLQLDFEKGREIKT
ncbi:LicD family protein [Candidatus Ventrimonas sp. KK005]|nr:LicD family protein [Lachnospiraceae bacterium]NBH17289.1 LicD family protein [Clostridiaceae bacterium]